MGSESGRRLRSAKPIVGGSYPHPALVTFDGRPLLTESAFVMSALPCLSGQQGVAAMPAEPPDGRKVKSGLVGGSKGSGDTEGMASRAK